MKILMVIFIILALLVLLEVYRELHSFQVTEYVVETGKLSGLEKECRIVFLSDLHNHVYGRENEKLLEAIKDAAPDLILVGGDMLVSKKKLSYDVALKFVKRLTDLAPVYYANGNHEQRLKERPKVYCHYKYEDYKEALQASGVHFLENESVDISVTCKESEAPERFKDKVVRITGLEIPLCSYKRAGRGSLELSEITECVGEREENVFQILLAHNPTYMKAYKAWGADLILSGHLHGGVVRIPGVTGVIAPSFQLFPKYSGDIYREEDMTIVVSKGLGTHTINFRLFNPAEAVVLHLRNKSCRK